MSEEKTEYVHICLPDIRPVAIYQTMASFARAMKISKPTVSEHIRKRGIYVKGNDILIPAPRIKRIHKKHG